jgi:L-ectoine synthase
VKVIDSFSLHPNRVVEGDGFISNRMLLESDNVGFSMTRTVIPVGKKNYWHYKNHYESNYCVSGHGWLKNAITGERYEIKPGMAYVLDNHDPHYFEAIEEVTLICVFNPPLKGREVHRKDGSYE